MPEGEGRYTPAEAWEEAEKKKEAMKSGEALGFAEAEKVIEQNAEKELSPEVVEKILKKVQDIDKSGTAYHSIGNKPGQRERLKEVVDHGILGSSGRDLVTPETWKVDAKSGNATIHFNIVGRSHFMKGISPMRREIAQSQYFGPDSIVVLFNIDNLKDRGELTPEQHSKMMMDESTKEIFKNKSYVSTIPYSSHNRKGIPDEEFGFLASHRITPKNFLGMVYGEPRSNEVTRNIDPYLDRNLPTSDVVGSEIVKSMLESYQDNPERLVPIYNKNGDLMWPRKMRYEEVKKLVAEREARKEAKE